MKSLRSLPIFAIIITIAVGCGSEPQKPAPGTTSEDSETSDATGNAAKGKSLYMTCATCHGQKGEGMQSLGAPALADQEPYYLKNQLQNFRTNKRGVHAKDAYGAQMAPMAKVLDSEGIKDVIAYIKTFPSPKIEATLEGGDAANGEAYYNMVCGACHGPGAVGIESLFSPRLVGMQDWYLERQLHNFQDSIRGVELGDTYGAQMLQIAADIPDEQTIKDLIAYINSLNAE
jgi:cytochrome c553